MVLAPLCIAEKGRLTLCGRLRQKGLFMYQTVQIDFENYIFCTSEGTHSTQTLSVTTGALI